ncbi:MAG: hypothetical protein L0H55_09655 [Candidatus Nitrosocosmicus sp.]|nr:hypothetical protein [Candidatus Nitrosocosmicus sp.]
MKFVCTLFLISLVYTIASSSAIASGFGSENTPLISDINKGTLIVNLTTVNGDEGKNKSSDFTVNIHANDPIPTTFKGNSSGTAVKLLMGMYSVTTSSIPNYNSSFSSDCTGGIMNVETKTCNIVNTYSNP